VARGLRLRVSNEVSRVREEMLADEFVAVVKLADVPANGMMAVDVKGVRIAIAHVDGAYYAFDDECTHEQCSLAEGDLAGSTVTCMCHGAEFDVRSGAVLAPPALRPVKVYRTRVDGDALRVEV
jgi:nitrite reductase/ring-hydroxylating ferredoxin subunit